MATLSPLLGRTLVLVAHPDDETVGAGALLQRMAEPAVVFATDAAPRDEYFWGRFGSRLRYARVREEEARQALAVIGVPVIEFLAPQSLGLECFVDQELFRSIPQALEQLSGLVTRLRPQALLTLAYEGGHPDHDVCNFLASVVARRHRLPAWEFPLYHRNSKDEIIYLRFMRPDKNEVSFDATPEEIEAKRTMVKAYTSQPQIIDQFDPRTERFRPLPAYDYSHPPHPGTLNYEAWRWPISGEQVCSAFKEYLRQERRQKV